MPREATAPDRRGAAVQELADQLGLSLNPIIDEALSLLLKAALEMRQGRQPVLQDPHGSQGFCPGSRLQRQGTRWLRARR